MKSYRKLGRKSLKCIGAKSRSALLAGLLVLGGGILLPMAAEAAEAEAASTAAAEESTASETPAYTMGEMVVTATRTEKKEVDVPMATEVITEEDIKDSGATNAYDALQKINGLEYGAMGPLGAAMGTMSNEVNIRGVDNGTLVLVNGNPISMRGKYYLEDIPADAIERIEVVKGGGSTLYGSGAMAGVVNVITKTEAANSAKVGFGNFGQQLYHLNVGEKGLMVTYDLSKWGDQNHVSHSDITGGSVRVDVDGTRKQSATISYKFNDHLSFLYGHYDTHAHFNRWITSAKKAADQKKVGQLLYDREFITMRDMAQLNYHDKNWKGSVYFNTGTLEARGQTNYANSLKVDGTWNNTREKNTTFGLDAQRNWKIGKGTLTAGLSGQHEDYQQLHTVKTKDPKEYSRDNWGVFAQWDQKIDKKNSFIIGGRETWTTGTEQNYSNFSASGQFLHKMTNNDSLYLNISQSFIMPTFANMYGSGNMQDPNPGLKPQKGVNYEIGWKNITGKHTWKAALFHIDIKDNISASWDTAGERYTYKNEDFRNDGFELSYEVECKNGFSYNAGLTWQNPVRKSHEKDYWDRKFGKIQLVGGINYKKDKWRASLQGSFLGARVGTDSKQPSESRRPYFLTSLTIAYAPTKLSEFELSVNNIFDRNDIISNQSSKYYAAPTNFLLSFTQKW